MSYKDQKKKALKEIQFNIVSIEDNDNWWMNEYWIIQPKYNFNIHYFICFMVNPLSDGETNQGQEICEIFATTKLPEIRIDFKNNIAILNMIKGNFEDKLKNFIDHIANYKF
jgi:hypothetical protein